MNCWPTQFGTKRYTQTVALAWLAAALISALFAPFYYVLLFGVDVKLAAVIAMSALLCYRHSQNIANLLAGKETRIGAKSAAANNPTYKD